MTRTTRSRRPMVMGIALALALAITACAPSENSKEARIAHVTAAVEKADERVTQASVEDSVDGLSFGWAVDIVVSGSESLTSDELGAVLLAARRAGDYDPDHVILFATDASGDAVDLGAAADGLDLRYSDVGSGISVGRDAIDDVLGARGASPRG